MNRFPFLRITIRNTEGASVRWRLFRSSLLLGFFLSLIALFLHVCWSVPLGDFASASTAKPNMAKAAELIPEVQTEPHTCGLHSLRSIYQSFNLDPDDYRLRARLGVDNPGLALDQNSTGTIQPDLYRVLDQDGFAFDADFSKQAEMESVYQHLAEGFPVMALIQRPETEGMHWIVLQNAEAESEAFQAERAGE